VRRLELCLLAAQHKKRNQSKIRTFPQSRYCIRLTMSLLDFRLNYPLDSGIGYDLNMHNALQI